MSCNKSTCSPPKEVGFEIPVGNIKKVAAFEIRQKNHRLTDSPSEKRDSEIFSCSFLLGFAWVITPCVYPMIPMTVASLPEAQKTDQRQF